MRCRYLYLDCGHRIGDGEIQPPFVGAGQYGFKYSIDTKGYRQRGDSPEAYGDFFLDGLCEYKTFRNDLKYDRASYIGRNLSSSHTPKEEKDPEKYNGYIKELNELFDEYNVNGILDFPQITKSYIGGA